MTKKKRIWITTVVITLVLVLMTVIYSCGSTKEEAPKEVPKQQGDTVGDIQSEGSLKKKDEDFTTATENKQTPEKDVGKGSEDEKKSEEKKDSSEKKSDTKSDTSSKQENGSNNKSDKKDDSSGNTDKKQESHTHTWEKQTKTVKHKESGHYEQVLVKEAWTEVLPTYESVPYEACNECGEDLSTGYTLEAAMQNILTHTKAHLLKGEKSGHHTAYRQKQTGTQTIEHPAEYENRWVVEPAWTETIVTGYQCSCGASK